MNSMNSQMSPPRSEPGTRPLGTSGEAEAARSVREMFARIAPRYDLLNRVLSLTLDRIWRRRTALAVRDLLQNPDSAALDLCCGTGDLALELIRAGRGSVIGSDFVHAMLTRAAAKAETYQARVRWLEADALAMPFAEGGFDVITVAFGFRNLSNYRRGLAEIYRLLKPGGRAAILEFAVPERGLFAALYRLYFRWLLPFAGNWFSGESGKREGAYTYLPASVERFPDCQSLAAWMEDTGFREVTCERWAGGAVALHLGAKPV